MLFHYQSVSFIFIHENDNLKIVGSPLKKNNDNYNHNIKLFYELQNKFDPYKNQTEINLLIGKIVDKKYINYHSKIKLFIILFEINIK